MRRVGLMFLAGAAMPGLVQAQQATPPAAEPAAPTGAAEPEETDETAPDLVVTGSRTLPGSVIGDIAPEEQLSPADIRSYGVSSVEELLAELAPQTRSGRGSGGAPVVLLNGRRVSSFSEIRNLPTEAIQRVDILPEEVALKYGYRADQRVVNFVLRRRFRALVAEATDTVPTAGGRNQPQGELDLLRIRRDTRASLHVEYTDAGALTEAERDVAQGGSIAAVGGNISRRDRRDLGGGLGTTVAVPGVAATRAPTLADFAPGVNATDQSAYRTLLPDTHTIQANGVYASSIFGNVAASLNARVEHTLSDTLRGLAQSRFDLAADNPYNPFGAPVTVTRAFDSLDPLAQRVTNTQLHLGGAMNGDAGRWRWSVTGNVDRSEDDTRTQTGIDTTGLAARIAANDPLANPYAAIDPLRSPDNTGRSRSTEATLDAQASGPLLRLPAGDASTSIKVSGATTDFSSRSVRLGTESSANVGRDIGSAQVNLDLPVASRREGFLSVLGNLTLNGNLAVDHLSDFGTLWTIGYGANWTPIDGVRFIGSVTEQDEAPSASQLGGPTVATPGVRVFDYVQGTTATVTTVTGGNPALIGDNRHVTKLALDLRPWKSRDISFSANYVAQHTDGAISAFPTATAAIEAVFPDRFVRDVDGTLLRIDTRPINYARTERSELRYGINLSFKLKSQIQKQLEAYRAGTGPNPFAGLRPPGGERRRDPAQPDATATPAAREGAGGTTPGDANGATTTPPSAGGFPGGGLGNGGGPGSGGVPGGGRGFGGGRFGGGGPGGGGGRLQFALYHTWHLTDRVLVADGGPSLDLLNGDAVTSSGGQSRHELEGQAGYSNNGLGARASLNFSSATRVEGGSPTSPETLNFGSLATINLRLFADLGQRLDLVRQHPWLRGVRVSASVTNLFNTRQRVTDETGAVPAGFQPAYLDALGRTVRVSVRKLFF